MTTAFHWNEESERRRLSRLLSDAWTAVEAYERGTPLDVRGVFGSRIERVKRAMQALRRKLDEPSELEQARLLHMKTHSTCALCGKEFSHTKGRGARYCTNARRQKAYRLRHALRIGVTAGRELGIRNCDR